MRVLLAGNGGPLADALASALRAAHNVEVIDAADALDRERAAAATAGRDAIVHVPLFAQPAASAHDAPDALRRLDVAGRATYNLITTAAGAQRFILVSTLRHFLRYPREWLVTERWAPRPTTHVDDLAPYLAETVVRETSRVLPLKGIALRLGAVHHEDAVQAVERALAFDAGNGWHAIHIAGAGEGTRFPLAAATERGFGYAPRHPEGKQFAEQDDAPAQPTEPVSTDLSVPARVVVFGAGGPIASAFARHAENDHTLRLVDIRPLAEIVAEGKPFAPGAPLPRLLGSPHEVRVADVTDLGQVLGAVEGMDAIVNLTAMRNHPVEAFRVNVLGPYNLMRAAVAKGIRRVVLSGPSQISLGGPSGYTYEDDPIVPEVPPRPGTELYFVSKLLGQHIGRIFAQEHGVEAPCLLIGPLLNPDPEKRPPNVPHGAYPFSVSWEDAGQAVHCALHAGHMPRWFEPFFLVADLPHGRFTNEKTKRLLKWEPKDRLEKHWTRGWTG
jgi:nucleoside-diphosphate-sugar epimerase